MVFCALALAGCLKRFWKVSYTTCLAATLFFLAFTLVAIAYSGHGPMYELNRVTTP